MVGFPFLQTASKELIALCSDRCPFGYQGGGFEISRFAMPLSAYKLMGQKNLPDREYQILRWSRRLYCYIRWCLLRSKAQRFPIVSFVVP